MQNITRPSVRFLLVLSLVLSSFGFAQDTFGDTVFKAAVAQMAAFTDHANTANASMYEDALKAAAFRNTQQNVAIPNITVPAKLLFTYDPVRGPVVTVLNEPVSNKTIKDYLPKPASEQPGYPVGGKYTEAGYENHYLALDYPWPGVIVQVSGRSYQAVPLGLMGRLYKLLPPN